VTHGCAYSPREKVFIQLQTDQFGIALATENMLRARPFLCGDFSCDPVRIPLDAFDLVNELTIDGLSRPVRFEGELVLSAKPIRQPEFDPSLIEVDALEPFRLSGHVKAFDCLDGEACDGPGRSIVEADLRGQGTLRVFVTYHEGSRDDRDMVYEIAPIPEPGTALLLVSALVSLGGGIHLRARSRS
jgi:hypothetical protein